MRLILASASPRRADLLRAAGFRFEIFPVDVDERFRDGETAEHYVARLAEEKARAAQNRGPGAHFGAGEQNGLPDPVFLGADTVVVCGGELLGKPADRPDAERMLRLLAGRTHEVLTGVCLLIADRSITRVERSQVRMSPMTGAEIAWYINSGEPMDKAGGYAVQGLASRFIEAVEGSYSNVVGLPVAAVYGLLKQLGCDILTI